MKGMLGKTGVENVGVQNIIKKLLLKYKTRDPFIIAEAENIIKRTSHYN
jgi:hypothetical protein